MLHSRTVLARDGVVLADVACRHGKGRGRDTERAGTHMLVFVRRGCFVRRAAANAALLDPTVATAPTPARRSATTIRTPTQTTARR